MEVPSMPQATRSRSFAAACSETMRPRQVVAGSNSVERSDAMSRQSRTANSLTITPEMLRAQEVEARSIAGRHRSQTVFSETTKPLATEEPLGAPSAQLEQRFGDVHSKRIVAVVS